MIKRLPSFDRRAVLILVWVPIALTLIEYFFVPGRAGRFFEWARAAEPGSLQQLYVYLWWIFGTLALAALVPTLLIRALGIRPKEIGLRFKGTAKHASIYLWLYLAMVPVIYLASQDPSFRSAYPFFQSIGGLSDPNFWIFEFAYFLQFFAVEYFFRGFMVLGLKPVLGPSSILVMLAPYCMIHFHKPFPEALAAIGAGLILGTLSYQTETVIYGWFLHYGVALTMDLLAMQRPF